MSKKLHCDICDDVITGDDYREVINYKYSFFFHKKVGYEETLCNDCWNNLKTMKEALKEAPSLPINYKAGG